MKGMMLGFGLSLALALRPKFLALALALKAQALTLKAQALALALKPKVLALTLAPQGLALVLPLLTLLTSLVKSVAKAMANTSSGAKGTNPSHLTL